MVFNYSLKPYLQKLTNISSWVIIYLLFFPMCGFELPLLRKHQKVLKVQATLMNALLTQLSAFQVILSFLLFFSVCFSGDWDFLFCMRVCLGRKSRLPRTPTLKGLLDITVYRDTKYWVHHQTGFATDLQKKGKNKKDKVNKGHNIFCFTDCRRVIFWLELKTDLLLMLVTIGLSVVRICGIKFFVAVGLGWGSCLGAKSTLHVVLFYSPLVKHRLSRKNVVKLNFRVFHVYNKFSASNREPYGFFLRQFNTEIKGFRILKHIYYYTKKKN